MSVVQAAGGEPVLEAHLPWEDATDVSGRHRRPRHRSRRRRRVAHDGTVLPFGVTLERYERELCCHGLSRDRAFDCIFANPDAGDCPCPDRPKEV